MNYKLRIDYFHPLTEEELTLFAPPREVMLAAASYNAALETYVSGKEEEGMRRLAQISGDYPLFAQAGHLYGILLAAEGRFEEAEEHLKRIRLLELAEDERHHLNEEIEALSRETRKLKRERARLKRREDLLMPVKSEIARNSILIKAGDDNRGVFSGAKEPAESDMQDGPALIYEDNSEKEKQKTALVLIFGIAIAVLALLLFFFLIRPGIMKQRALDRERNERLEWLEKHLLDRAPKQQDIAAFLAEYQNWLSAGRPAEMPGAQTSAPADESETPSEADVMTSAETGPSQTPESAVPQASEQGTAGP